MTAAPRLLFHVSDLHFGNEDRAALDWFAQEVARERPDAVICTGDLTMRGSAREFAAAQDYLASLGVPLWVVPGVSPAVPYYIMLRRRSPAVAGFACSTPQLAAPWRQRGLPSSRSRPWRARSCG